jgi:uncharacterized membrane protein YqjE
MTTYEPDDEPALEEEEERRGLFGSAKGVLHRLIGLLHRRAELFSTELEEEITRLIGVLIWSFVGVQCAIIGLTFVAVTVLLAVPEGYRAWVAGALAVIFIGIAVIGALSIKKIVAAKTRPFDASLRELEKDREHLKGRR